MKRALKGVHVERTVAGAALGLSQPQAARAHGTCEVQVAYKVVYVLRDSCCMSEEHDVSGMSMCVVLCGVCCALH